jgi:hypothetical protein
MIIYDELYSWLQTKSAITALVGTRIYPLHTPDDPVFPCLVLRQSGSEHDDQLGGAAGMQTTTMDVEVHAKTLAEMIQTTEAVRSVLQGFKGAMSQIPFVFALLKSQTDTAYYLAELDQWVVVRIASFSLKFAE